MGMPIRKLHKEYAKVDNSIRSVLRNIENKCHNDKSLEGLRQKLIQNEIERIKIKTALDCQGVSYKDISTSARRYLESIYNPN